MNFNYELIFLIHNSKFLIYRVPPSLTERIAPQNPPKCHNPPFYHAVFLDRRVGVFGACRLKAAITVRKQVSKDAMVKGEGFLVYFNEF